MGNIGDILKSRNYDEPQEVMVIKEYLRSQFNAGGEVALRENQIIITVKSAALAGTLRMHARTLQQMCETNKRLVIRIG